MLNIFYAKHLSAFELCQLVIFFCANLTLLLRRHETAVKNITECHILNTTVCVGLLVRV